jgi:hypothetical protein
VGDKTIIRRGIDAIRCISRFLSSAEPVVRHNAVLAKWEQYYDAHPTTFTRQNQHGALRYLNSGGLRKSSPPHGEIMSTELKDYLFNSGAALVLHGIKELVDADLAKLRDFPEEQRAAITSVVLSNTHITGDCFQYLAFLPNLRALYVNKTQVKDDAPLECLPKTLETINLDHSEIGDVCVSKLRIAPNLRSVRVQYTGITNRGVNILATMSNLRDCHVDDKAILEYTRRRLNNAMVLRAATFNSIMYFLLYTLQLKASKYMFRVRNLRSAWYFRLPLSMVFRSSY